MDLETKSTSSSSQPPLHSGLRGQASMRSSNTSRGLSRPSSQRTPLRAVENNSALLKTPGPLETMLKTTTETGDIGLFTIRANTSPATYSQPPRPRPFLPNVPLPQSARSRRPEERSYFQDDRMRLPSSYRDTTSEILSLYGSEARHSRAFTPSNDDGPRSFSLTSCSSRHIPPQKSSATLQSVSSTSTLQRPRSPFPYPTRLRRPGTRPSSPTVTDNGAIDYIRMIEHDRPHQRPLHAGHQLTHTYGSRLRPTLSLNCDTNRSTSSLPSRSSPGPQYLSPSPYRSRTPSSCRTRTPRPSERSCRGSNEPRLRSPSLTSIVEMYQRPATSNPTGPRLRSTGSFYYDYSEEFENNPLPVVDPEIPLCPIPHRVPSLSRPMVLRAEEGGVLDQVDRSKEDGRGMNSIVSIPEEGQGGESAAISEHATGAPIGDPSSHELGHIPEPPVSCFLLVDPNMDDLNKPHEAGYAQRQVSELQDTQESTRESARPKLGEQATSSSDADTPQASQSPPVRNRFPSFATCALGTNVSSPGKRCRRSNTIGARVDNSTHRAKYTHKSHSSLRNLRNSLDPTLLEFASLLTSFDRLAKSPFSKKGESGVSSGDTESLMGRIHQSQDSSAPHDKRRVLVEPSSSQQSSEATEDGRLFQKRHRRNLAATRISTTNVAKYGDDRISSEGRNPSYELSLPGSTSSAHHSKVKRSIPQLMKALPPLPAGAETSDDDDDYPTRNSKNDIESTSNNNDDMEDDCGRAESEPEASPPKLKFRIKPLPSTPKPHSDLFNTPLLEKPSTADSTGSPTQRKLKIKISRHPAAFTHTGRDGTMLRSPALKQCNSLADLEHCARKDIFTNQCRLQNTFSEPVRDPKADVETRHGKHDTTQDARLDMKRSNKVHPSPPSGQTGLRSTQSTMLEMTQYEHHGLRQKLSFLRLRLGISQGVVRGPMEEETQFSPEMHSGPGSPPALFPKTALKDFQPKLTALRSGKAKHRVRGWAKGAKNAMRRAMRKTLDRSAGLAT